MLIVVSSETDREVIEGSAIDRLGRSAEPFRVSVRQGLAYHVVFVGEKSYASRYRRDHREQYIGPNSCVSVNRRQKIPGQRYHQDSAEPSVWFDARVLSRLRQKSYDAV